MGPEGFDSSAGWDGYAFYHSQDAERLAETRPTYVAFGVFLCRYPPIDEIKAMPLVERDVFADEKAEVLASSVIVSTFKMCGIDVDYCVLLDEGGLKDGCAVGG